jgi:hypothetical protein
VRLLAAAVSAIAAMICLPAQSAPPVAQPSVDNVYWLVGCLFDHRDRNVERVLSTVPGDSDATLSWMRAVIGPCLVAERPLSGPDLFGRGAVAEHLLYRDFAAIGASPRRRTASLFAPVSQDYLGRASENSRRFLAILDMGSCVTRREPAKVYGFFHSGRGSAAERAAMTELTPAISACLFEGQTFDMTPPLFRALLAEAAYRVAAGQPNVYEEPMMEGAE